jgi:NAD-dependent dihydropyrimidine dehydrogenase PreA subunit
MGLLDDFARIFRLPPAMIPHIEFVAQPEEIALVVALGNGPLTAEQLAVALGWSVERTDALLQSAYPREIVNRTTRDGVSTYSPASFYHRLDPLSMYENWGDVPAEARDAVIQWQLDEFIKNWLPVVDEMLVDPDKYFRIPNRDVLLLDEALSMVDFASEHVVVPCDCRAIVMACKRPLETCVRLDAGAERTLERGHGRRLTKNEMKTLVVDANRNGLMATGDRYWREHGGLFGFCNCCACDCYPIRAGQQLQMDRQWPRSHYVAERDMSKCEQCGLCVRRCHFDAFYHDGAKTIVSGKSRKTVLFDPMKCWGCGLCATTCPDNAITMTPLGTREPGSGPLVASDPDVARQGVDANPETEQPDKGAAGSFHG